MLRLTLVALMLVGCGGEENASAPKKDAAIEETKCHPEAKDGTFAISEYQVIENICSDGSRLQESMTKAPSDKTVTMIWDEEKLDELVCLGSTECSTRWDARIINGCNALFGGSYTNLVGGLTVTTNQTSVDTFEGYSFVRKAKLVYSFKNADGLCALTWTMKYVPIGR